MEINGGVLLGLASPPSHVLCAAGCQPAMGEEPKIALEREMIFLVVLWIAVCPEGAAGVVAAVRCVMGVSGGSAHDFGMLCTPAEELVVVVMGAGGDSQVCSKGEV